MNESFLSFYMHTLLSFSSTHKRICQMLQFVTITSRNSGVLDMYGFTFDRI